MLAARRAGVRGASNAATAAQQQLFKLTSLRSIAAARSIRSAEWPACTHSCSAALHTAAAQFSSHPRSRSSRGFASGSIAETDAAEVYHIPLPPLGAGVAGGTLSRWLVSDGSRVHRGQPLCQVTLQDGSVIGLPSSCDAVILRLHVQEGEFVEVGSPLLQLQLPASVGPNLETAMTVTRMLRRVDSLRAQRNTAAVTQELAALLALCNDAGMHERVLFIVTHQVAQEEANAVEVAREYWRARDTLEGVPPQPSPTQPDSSARDMASRAFSSASSSSSPQSFPQPPPREWSPLDPFFSSHSSSSASRDPPVLYTRVKPKLPWQPYTPAWSKSRLFTRPDEFLQFKYQFLLTCAALAGLVWWNEAAIKAWAHETWERLTSQARTMHKQFPPATVPSTRFKDVCGCDEAKAELVEAVEFLKNPAKFTRLGGKMPGGFLLLGPPGTGKTLLARAVAGEAGVPFFSVTGSDFEERYVGVGSKRVRDLFAQARKLRRAIIFIDEIDSVGGKRDPHDIDRAGIGRATLNQLLSEMDGFTESSGIIVIAATNHADSLDPALVRPGRFDRHISVPVPDIKGRKEILKLYGDKLKLASNVDLSSVARGTAGMTGADLYQLLNTAALHASAQSRPQITAEDLEYAKDKQMLGIARVSGVLSPEMKKHLAYYHAGHSLVSLHTAASPPLHKVTIVQRGELLGMVSHQYASDEDKTSSDYKEMLARVDLCMGGRVAEELVYGADDVTSHAGRDLGNAGKIARGMVMQLGFGAEHGPLSQQDDQHFAEGASDAAKRSVDKEVQILLAQSHERVKKLLKNHEKELHRVAAALMQHETLSAAQVEQVARGMKLAIEPSAAAAAPAAAKA